MGAEKRIMADVLIVGGGIAGCFAAVKAYDQGADVVLVDKGYAGKSGQTPFATDFMVFDPDKGHDFNDWMRYINKTSEYINNRYWTELTIKESFAVFHELLSWGLEFKPDDGGPDQFLNAPKGLSKPLLYDPADMSRILRKQVAASGVKIFDRVMITELLKQDGRVSGAVGIAMDNDDLHVFIAKTTVLCAGACGFKPPGFSPIAQLTCDGEAMAYRAGAEIGGKEFVDTHYTAMEMPSILGRKKSALSPELEARLGLGPDFTLFGEQFNALGDRIDVRPEGTSGYRFTYLQKEIEAHLGRAPIISQGTRANELVGGAALGMSLRKADGLWPASSECASTVPGLYAAGDSLYTIQNGAVYAFLGSSMAGSAITGSIAGAASAKEALNIGKTAICAEEIDRAKKFVLAPTERQGGFSPGWVTQLLQNTMMPYFISYIKKEDRLLAAQTIISFIRDHLAPCLYAQGSHELRLAHETKNMVLSAEMRLKSSIFRTESRGNHYREDFPRRDDACWLAWSKIREDHGEMKLMKVPIPQEWRPDLSLPYEERYPFRFPGEV